MNLYHSIDQLLSFDEDDINEMDQMEVGHVISDCTDAVTDCFDGSNPDDYDSIDSLFWLQQIAEDRLYYLRWEAPGAVGRDGDNCYWIP